MIGLELDAKMALRPIPIDEPTLPKTSEGCDSIGIPLQESRAHGMRDLKEELASLRIERDRPPRRWGKTIGWLVLLALVAGAALYYFFAKPSIGAVCRARRRRSRNHAGQRSEHRRTLGRNPDPHRVRLSGGAQAIRHLVKDSGSPLGTAGGRGKRRPRRGSHRSSGRR